MGRKLTEAEKVKRAAQAIVRKEKAEVGPLFADSVQPPDLFQLRQERRNGLACNMEGLHEIMGGWTSDELYLQQLHRLAKDHLFPWFEDLDDYANRVYRNNRSNLITFWVQRLATMETIPFRHIRVEEGDATIMLGGHGNQKPVTIKKARIVPIGFFPPPGWWPPFTRDTLPSYPSKCRECTYYHPASEPCVEHAIAGGKEISWDTN